VKPKTTINKYFEVQNENRILLKKMLSIDLKPSNLNPAKISLKHIPSTTSLNRVSRLRELVRVNEENKTMLRRLQNAHATYDKGKWEKDFEVNKYFEDMIRKNSSRYCKHPYFVQNPTCGSQMDMYSSVQSGRTMSANPMSRMQY
jgi:hypothetical protein